MPTILNMTTLTSTTEVRGAVVLVAVTFPDPDLLASLDDEEEDLTFEEVLDTHCRQISAYLEG